MAPQTSPPAGVRLLIALMIFQGVSGLFGGTGLVSDPSGETLQIPFEWLNGSPFSNYLIPGWILLIVLGIFPLTSLYGLFRRQRWGWFTALTTGAALIIWIGVEILIIGYQPHPPLQFIYGLAGIIILGLALLPSVKNFYVGEKNY